MLKEIGITITLGGAGKGGLHGVQFSFPLNAPYPAERCEVTGSLSRGMRLEFGRGRKIQRGLTPKSRHRFQVLARDLGVEHLGCTQELVVPLRYVNDLTYDIDGIDLVRLKPRTPRSRVSTKNTKSGSRCRYEAADPSLFDAVRIVQRAIESGDASWRLRDGKLVFLVLAEI